MDQAEQIAGHLLFLQACLNYYPDQSPFWDTNSGQDVLRESREKGITAHNTNRQRWNYIYEARREGAEDDGFAAAIRDLFQFEYA